MSLDQIKENQLNEIIATLDFWYNKASITDQSKANFVHFDQEPRSLYEVRNEIAASWVRSKNKGITPQKEIVFNNQLPSSLFDKVLNENYKLLEIVHPILHEAALIFKQLNSFGINLFDRNAILLYAQNYPLKQIQPGLDFSEEKIGTSAVSISLALNKPASLFGTEVYNETLRFSKFIVSIPIHDPEGRIQAIFAVPYFRQLKYTKEEKQMLLFLVSLQFSIAQRMQNAIRESRHQLYIPAENPAQKNHIKKQNLHNAVYSLEDIKGDSPLMVKAKDIARKIAHNPGNILLVGESGTGKELFAHAIHRENSGYKPFIAINCAAISPNLIESELFGYEGGSFTGAARKGRSGKIEMADGGTLFLDEIGDMPPALQPVLLRVLEDKKIMRVGGNQYIPVNFRVISATNKNLYEMVQRKAFREDLYYRLAALKLPIPPLRSRENDILYLTRIFIRDFCNQLDIPILDLEPEVINCLQTYHWPGNIRELKNCILWAVSTAEDRINLDNLPDEILQVMNNSKHKKAPHDLPHLKQKAIEEIEFETIRNCMEQCGYNISQAAKRLGISRPTLYRKLQVYGLTRS